MAIKMPRDGAIIFADLIGRLDVLYVNCPKCSRAGRYRVQHLVEERGRNSELIDWLDEITADCPKKQAHNMFLPLHFLFKDLTQYQECYWPNSDPNSQPLCMSLFQSRSESGSAIFASTGVTSICGPKYQTSHANGTEMSPNQNKT